MSRQSSCRKLLALFGARSFATAKRPSESSTSASPTAPKASNKASAVQVRHREPLKAEQERQLVVAVSNLNSGVNLSSVARTASSFKVSRLLTGGALSHLIPKVARESPHFIEVEKHNSLAPTLGKLKAEGYRIVALEQTTKSKLIYDYKFPPKSVICLGNERSGVGADILAVADDCVEIPIYQLPHSLNVGSAAAIAIYEYCKQHRIEHVRPDTVASSVVAQTEKLVEAKALKTARKNKKRAIQRSLQEHETTSHKTADVSPNRIRHEKHKTAVEPAPKKRG